MKKSFAILLSLVFVFLVGCSDLSSLVVKEQAGFVQMDIQAEYLQDAHSICSKDDLIVFMTSVLRDKQGNFVQAQSEEDYEKNTIYNYIVEYNARKNKLINVFELKDCPIKEIWGIELEDDKIVVFSDSEKKNAYYDLDMNFIELTDRTVVDELEIAKKSSFFTEGSGAYDGYCCFNGTNNMQYIFFYDNPEELYIFDADYSYQPNYLDKATNNMLCESFSGDSNTAEFRIVDYRNANELNFASINAKELGYEYISTNSSCLGNKYVVCVEYFGNDDSEDFSYGMYCWNYNIEPENKALDIKKYTSLDSVNSQTIADIKQKYNVDIHINEECDNIDGMVKCDEDINSLYLYDDLHALNVFFSSLPDGMVKEIYSGFYDENFEHDGIRIDIVSQITYENDITNSVAAFAQRWSNPMEVCFSYNSMGLGTIAHEFMHLLDHRIDDYLNHSESVGIYESWDKLNKGYEHDYDENEELHPQYTFDDKNFVSDYAASNGEEDRAVIFEYLYTSHGDSSKPWMEPERINKKVTYLTELIKNAFPSAQKTDNIYWEI